MLGWILQWVARLRARAKPPGFDEQLRRALADDDRITLRVSTLERALRLRG